MWVKHVDWVLTGGVYFVSGPIGKPVRCRVISPALLAPALFYVSPCLAKVEVRSGSHAHCSLRLGKDCHLKFYVWVLLRKPS